MNTKYSNWKMWYYVLCMVLTLQLAACFSLMQVVTNRAMLLNTY